MAQNPTPAARIDFGALKATIHRKLIQKLNLDRLTEIRREDVRREVAQILEIFASMFRDAGPRVTVLRVKRAVPGWQAVQDIAKAEWEKLPGNPRIEWVDTAMN